MRHAMTLVMWGATLLIAPIPALAKPAPEFAAIASATGGERIDLTGVPAWRDGSFRLGGDTSGTVRRRSRGYATDAAAFQPGKQMDDGFAAIGRSGSLRFSVSGPRVGAGTVTGDCRFDRVEERLTLGAVALLDPVLPVALDCRFARDGAAIGTLRLEGVADGRGIVSRAPRVGQVQAGGTTLTIRSLHRVGALGIRSELPLGYAFSAGGADVAAVDLNAVRKRRLVMARDPAQRDAALLGGIALALFWDPGDTDD